MSSQILEEEPVQTAPEKKSIFGAVNQGRGAHVCFWVPIWVTVAVWAMWCLNSASLLLAVVTTVSLVFGLFVGFCLRPPRTRRTLVILLIAVPLVLGFIDLQAYTKASAERDRIETQQREQQIAAEKPWHDAEARAKASLEGKNYWVQSVALNPNDFSQGRARLSLYAQGRSMEAAVVLIKVGDDWTVNCPADGGPIDVTANGNQLAIALNATGQCPAGLKKPAPTP